MVYKIELSKQVRAVLERNTKSFASIRRIALDLILIELKEIGSRSTILQTDAIRSISGKHNEPVFSSRLIDTSLPVKWRVRWYSTDNDEIVVIDVESY